MSSSDDESSDGEYVDANVIQLYLNAYLQGLLEYQSEIEGDDEMEDERELKFEEALQQKRQQLKGHDFQKLMDQECGIESDSGRNIASKILELDMNYRRDPQTKIQVFSKCLPTCQSEKIGTFENHLFCGQFSKNGELFVSACQDQVIRMYTTEDLEYQANMNEASTVKVPPKPYKLIECLEVGWSVIDVAFSPSQKFIAYSSWTPNVHLVGVTEDDDPNKQLKLPLQTQLHHRFCPFSIKFSPDSNELLAGASDARIYIYDLEKDQLKSSFEADTNDINSVEYTAMSSEVFLSGGDSGIIRVWDSRQLGTHNSPAGGLAGHTLGITHINSKGDGCFFISQSKDQSIKLFDMRKMKDLDDLDGIVSGTHWDYRNRFCPSHYQKRVHENDLSLMTYAGSHSVLQTLIRCYFSPKETTGQKYIYTGSSDGNGVIYDILTGKKIVSLVGHDSVTRDISWHPEKALIITSSWDHEMRMWRNVNDITEFT